MPALFAACAVADDVPLVAVVNGQQALPYRQTQNSFETALRKNGRVDVISIESYASLQSLTNRQPALVFALGSAAVKESHGMLGDQPLLATMILSTTSLKSSAEATAILVKPSAKRQLQWHRRFLPDARRVGVLYDPSQSQSWLEEAKAAASELDLEIIAAPVTSPQQLPAALKSLERNADSILGIPDKTVYSSKTAKSILLFSFRKRIPFVGMSAAWVKAGALYGVDWDYEDLGRQCASVALKILDGTSAANIAPQLPEKFTYQLNLRTARQFKMKIGDELIAGASEVYK